MIQDRDPTHKAIPILKFTSSAEKRRKVVEDAIRADLPMHL